MCCFEAKTNFFFKCCLDQFRRFEWVTIVKNPEIPAVKTNSPSGRMKSSVYFAGTVRRPN